MRLDRANREIQIGLIRERALVSRVSEGLVGFHGPRRPVGLEGNGPVADALGSLAVGDEDEFEVRAVWGVADFEDGVAGGAESVFDFGALAESEGGVGGEDRAI